MSVIFRAAHFIDIFLLSRLYPAFFDTIKINSPLLYESLAFFPLTPVSPLQHF